MVQSKGGHRPRVWDCHMPGSGERSDDRDAKPAGGAACGAGDTGAPAQAF